MRPVGTPAAGPAKPCFERTFPSDLPPVGCVIMASGLGKRFQREGTPRQNKLLADFRGRPLIAFPLELALSLPFAARTAVTRSPELAALCRARGVDTVLHTLPHRSDTVRLGLERLEELSPRPPAGCLFFPGDQPLLRRESVLALLAAFAQAPERICRLCWDGGAQPVPGSPILFPRRLFGALKRLPEGMGGSFLAGQKSGQLVWVPVRDEWELRDADTPEDLQALLNHIQ